MPSLPVINIVEGAGQPASQDTQATPWPIVAEIWGCDPYLVKDRLSKDADRLFATTVDELEAWRLGYVEGGTNRELRTCLIQGPVMLKNFGQIETRDDTFYILRQQHTFDRIRITKETFQVLLSMYQVFPYFMNTVHAFGLRVRDERSTFGNFHFRKSGSDHSDIEICYTLRFFEKRDDNPKGDQWSLRQTGIYQRLNCPKQISTWVIIQPSKYAEGRLKSKLSQEIQDVTLRSWRHVIPHILLLSSSVINWREYIDHQASELEELEQKAAFIEVDRALMHDYRLSFVDRQSVQLIRRKLWKAALLLQSALDLVYSMRGISRDANFVDPSLLSSLNIEFDEYENEIKDYKLRVDDLIQRSSDTNSLLSNILEYRVGTSTLKSSQASDTSLQTMKRIAQQGEWDTKVAQKTSIAIKALTVAATMYLPASLLAGIFCSNLIGSENGHLVVIPDFWKYFVVLIPMVAVTFGLVAGLQAFWVKSFELEKKSQKLEPS